MNNFDMYAKRLMWSTALVFAVCAAGCRENNANNDDGITGAPAGAVQPGAACPAGASSTIPMVTLSDPSNGNHAVTTSTNSVAGGGKSITATFSIAMNSVTIDATTFVLTPVGGIALAPASVSYNATTKVATLTTSSALLTGTSYTAVVTTNVTSAGSVPLSCIYAWNFRTGASATTGLAPVTLGLAASSAIASTAGLTNTLTAPITHINGDVALDPNTGCNAVPIDAAGGFGLCGGAAPTINGTVVSPLYPDAGATSGAIASDLQAAFLSITPPAGPPATGSLGGATSIPAGTTLGAATGSAMVQGDNLFVPGLYQSLTSILITGDLTLDAQGDANAVFIFQSSSTLGAAAGAASPGAHTRILLINGAKASNVWWQVASSATLGTNAQFQGNVLAAANITMETGATSCGRLMAGAWVGGGGALVFDSNVISVPGSTNAPSNCR